jgi:acyl-CoA thioester hydrolase
MTIESEGPETEAVASPDRVLVRSAHLRVRYAETDRMGVVYYANYLVWFEVGRTEWLRQSGWTYREMEQAGFSLPVIEAACQYYQPARYDDEIEIRTRATMAGRVRVRFDYEIFRNAERQLVASGHTVHAVIDPNGRPCRPPDRVLRVLR